MASQQTRARDAGIRRTVVVAAVIETNGRFLLACRAAGSDLAGLWEFPGGKVEAGETLEQALKREIREELGVEITVTDSRPVKTVRWEYSHADVELIALRARISAGEPRPLDHSELAWFSADEMTSIEMLPADRPIAYRLQLTAGISPVRHLRPERRDQPQT